MSIKQIDGYKIKMTQPLGKGSFGSVYVGEADKTHKKVAIKIINKKQIDSDDYLKGALYQQIKIMQSLKNPNIVQFIEVMQSSKNYYIVQQLCDGDISHLMKNQKKFTESESIDMLTQICNGFLALVKQGIVHRDLKPANIMIKDKILKIGDFGFAKKIPNPKQKVQSVVGTPLYMPIQILKSQDYTSKCDIWALGMIFYEILHGFTAWTANRQYQLIQNIQNKPLQIKRKDLSSNTVDFLKKCLGVRQSQRLSWDQLFVHPIFQGFFTNEGGSNQVFENKLKSILNDLRFYIKSNNLDLCKILFNMGYKSQQQQLNFQDYFLFLKTVNPTIKKQQALYVFRQTDTDNSNSISIKQIQTLLNKHMISFSSIFNNIPAFKRGQTEDFSKMSEETLKKINNCFTRLYRIIEKNKKNNLTLKQVFNDFDKQKDGRLSQKEFIYMIKKLDSGVQDSQIIEAFNFIDEDGSKTIEYDQLNKYYCKVNGIPLEDQFHQKSSKKLFESMDIQQPISTSLPGQPNSQSKNGLFKVNHQNSFPSNYPPGYMQGPMGGYNMTNMNTMNNMNNMNNMSNMNNMNNMNSMGFIPPPPQNYGMFGNFVMNQLQQNIHSPYQQPPPQNMYGFNPYQQQHQNQQHQQHW